MRQFHISSLDDSNSSFHCRFYSRYRYKKNFRGQYHSHAYSEIFFVLDGKGFFHLHEKKTPIHRGMIILINSNVQHTESSHPDSELEYAALSVDNLIFAFPQIKKDENVFFLDFQKEYNTLSDYIAKIEYESSKKDPFWQYALQTHLNSYILHLLRSSNLLALPVQTEKRPNPMAKVHLYLTANYDEDITLDKMADMFSMNKYYLAHAFKSTYGSSLIHTLNQIRCQQARHLLQDTDYSINDIASSVGYNSNSYFTKIYHQFYNETPSQTRKSTFE